MVVKDMFGHETLTFMVPKRLHMLPILLHKARQCVPQVDVSPILLLQGEGVSCLVHHSLAGTVHLISPRAPSQI